MFDFNEAKVETVEKAELKEVLENEQAVLEPETWEGTEVSENGLDLTPEEEAVYQQINAESIRVDNSLNANLEIVAVGSNLIPGGAEESYCVFAGANSRCGCKCCR